MLRLDEGEGGRADRWDLLHTRRGLLLAVLAVTSLILATGWLLLSS